MGEMAEDMQDGTACSICGMLFKDPKKKNYAYTHGYPVACKQCFRSGMKKQGVQKALVRTF